jgi:hypothetical protein
MCEVGGTLTEKGARDPRLKIVIMMPMTTKDLNLKVLNRLYYEEIDKFEARLDELEAAFNGLCDEIKKAAHLKLNGLPKNDRMGRKGVLAEEKKELDRVLEDLRASIKKSSREMRKALEKIQAQKEALAVDEKGEPSTSK